MILRKPYAFLIKYFKLINFILSALLVYIAYRNYNIISFFNEYISNDYSGSYFPGFSNQYISQFVYLVLIIILIGSLAIFFLLIYKKKQAKLYLFNMVYVIIFIIFLSFIKNVMITLETGVITAEAARIYRDVSILIMIPQIPLILLLLLRSFGFNTKKLNFESDIKELEISEQDNEEVEITFNKNNYKLKRNVNRFIREFKYYIRENKFIFIIICIILLGILGYTIYRMVPNNFDNNYNQGEYFSIGNFTYAVEDSIITNLNYKGDILDGYYLVAKINIKNNANEGHSWDYNDFRLMIGEEYVYPAKDKGLYFIDYANSYYKGDIKAKSKNAYSLVYPIDKEDISSNYQIKVLSGTKMEDNKVVPKYNYVNITPIVIDKVNTILEVNQNELLNFSNSYMNNTNLTLSNVLFTKKYLYNYEYCVKEKCNNYKDVVNIDYTYNNTTLVVMDYAYEIDNTIPFYKSSSSINTFAKTFMKIKYYDNEGNPIYADINEVTPNNLEGKLVIETTNKILDSKEVDLAIIIRNKEYIVNIK